MNKLTNVVENDKSRLYKTFSLLDTSVHSISLLFDEYIFLLHKDMDENDEISGDIAYIFMSTYFKEFENIQKYLEYINQPYVMKKIKRYPQYNEILPILIEYKNLLNTFESVQHDICHKYDIDIKNTR